MPKFLAQCVSHLEDKLNKYKGQMLDHKPFMIKQTFKMFERIDYALRSIVDLGDASNVFISSSLS